MECNLDPPDRTLRIVAGVFIFLGGLVLTSLSYLQILDEWWWIIAGALVIVGVGSMLSAVMGYCALKRITGV